MVKSEITWKEIPGFREYEVSEYGDLRKGSKYYKPERTCGNGRKRFTLVKDGQLYRYKAAQLVARAFIGPPPFEGAETRHKDGIKLNDHYSNLCWGSHSQNMFDRSYHELELKSRNQALPKAEAKKLEIAMQTAFFLGNNQAKPLGKIRAQP